MIWFHFFVFFFGGHFASAISRALHGRDALLPFADVDDSNGGVGDQQSASSFVNATLHVGSHSHVASTGHQRVFKDRRRNIVFSAAGDSSSVSFWMKDNCDNDAVVMDFVLFISYYDEPSKQSDELKNAIESTSGIFEYESGYKMDLLFSAMQSEEYKDFFNNGEYIGIFDDDLNFNSAKLNLLFQVHSQNNLMLSTPSISAPARGWQSNAHVDKCFFRRGAFIEIHSPVMSVSHLKHFFSIWHPNELVGYGTEHIISTIFKVEFGMTDSDYAVIDAIEVSNPAKRSDTGSREIDQFMSESVRARHFHEYTQNHPEQFDGKWVSSMASKWHSKGFGQCEQITAQRQQDIDQLFCR